MVTKTNKKTLRVDDGYFNAFMPNARRGRSTNYSAEMMAGGHLLSQPILESAYIHNGFARLICDTAAEEMTRAGFEIEGLEESLTESIKSRLEELEATKRFNEAIKWRNAFGGGIIILGLDDGGTLKDALNEKNVKGVEFMRVYDRYEAICDKRYDDPNNAKYGEVEIWRISPKSGGSSYEVHESRVLVFDGESVPNSIRVANDGWGASVIQKCFTQLSRLDKSYKLQLLLLERMQQAVHGIPNLSDQVSTKEGEDLVRKRIDIVDSVRGALNTVVIDADESYEIKGMTLSGVKDITESNIEALSAVSQHPTFLMGRIIGGLGGNDSSKEGWYSQVEAWQNDQYRKPLDRLISLILLASSDGTSDGGEYTIEFCPLAPPSEKDEAEIEYKEAQTKKVEAETAAIYVNLGAIDQDEVRENIREEYDLIGDMPEPEPEPLSPMVLNPGQTLVDPVAGNGNPAIVGK